jgi:hypothetical protein
MAKVMYLRHAEEMSSAMMRARMLSTESQKILAMMAAAAKETPKVTARRVRNMEGYPRRGN